MSEYADDSIVPKQYSKDPVADALYHIAAAILQNASATNGILYALKYSKDRGLSVAEAIEVSAKTLAEAVDGLGSSIEQAASHLQDGSG